MDCTTTTTEAALKQQNNNKNNASNVTSDTTSLSHDEVDFVPVATTTTTNYSNTNNNNNNHIINNKIMSNGSNNFKATADNALDTHTNSNITSKMFGNSKAQANEHLQYQQQQQQQQQQKSVSKSKKKSDNSSSNTNNNNNNNASEEPKKKSSTKERLSLFSTLGRRISQKALGHKDPHASATNCAAESATGKSTTDVKENPPKTSTATANIVTTTTTTTIPAQHTNTSISPPPPRRQRTFVKSSSIARLLGSTYQHHVKKFEKHQQQQQQKQSIESGKSQLDAEFHTFGGRRRSNGPYLDRFKHYSKDDADVGAGAATSAADAGGKHDDDASAASGGVATAESAMDFSDVLEMEAHHSAAYELQRNASNGLERFCDYSTVAAGEDEAAAELGSKTMRTLSRSLGRLWGKRLHSVDISTPDPEYKVSYLGNVLTGWAKGEGCVEKQLNTLWRNYTQNNKPDMIMRIKVCASGLKATTRQHGLTEYWANRITHCCAPKNYPRIFCWVYRHEGRKMKHELRCHAVLCSKEKVVQDICNTLKENLKRALLEFKREKILKQNARLSLANAAYENPSLPRRKILLIVGGNNYRPPLERSKSAPKLMAIEEAIGEEEGEDAEETNEPEMKSCCQKDSLYPAMTLGRRHCRRGHSIRRTGKARPLCSISLDESQKRKQLLVKSAADACCHNKSSTKECINSSNSSSSSKQPCAEGVDEQRNSYGSDESDDFEKLLKFNDYDTNTSLTTELLPYFDMQLHKNTSSSLTDLCDLKGVGVGDGEGEEEEEEPLSLPPTVNSDPMAHPEGDMPLATNRTDLRQHSTETEGEEDDADARVALRRTAGVCSDGEEDYLDADDDMYFRQARILNILHRHSMRKMAQLSLSSDEGSSSIETNGCAPLQYRHQTQSSISSNASSNATTNSSALDAHSSVSNTGKRHSSGVGGGGGGDSDEGSISSGCETASTVTANQDDLSLQYRHDKQLLLQQQAATLIDGDDARFFAMPLANEHTTGAAAATALTVDDIYQRLEARLQRRQNSDATTFSSSSTITLKMGGTGSEGSQPDSPNELKNSTERTMQEDQVRTTAAADGTTRAHRQRQRYEAVTIAPPPCDFDDDNNAAIAVDDTDSECSDESGYVEYREEREKTVREKVYDVERRELVQQQEQQQLQEQQQQQHYNQHHHPVAHQRMQKPQLPPKPMPRRTLSGGGGGVSSTAAKNLLSSQRTDNGTAV